MPAEIEAKIKVADLAATRRAIESAGGSLARRRLETNIFFDAPGNSLRRADKGLRLRVNHDLNTGRDSYLVTFKGPQKDGPYKNRDEIEFTVDDPGAAEAMLDRLGFFRTISFEKRRESWTLRGCQVELDEMPYLGTFVEIEGPDNESIKVVQSLLGLENQPIEKTSYIALLMRHVETNHITSKDIRF